MHPFRSTCYDRTVYWPNKQSRHKYYIQDIDCFHQQSCNISTITACLQLLQVTAKPFLHCEWVNHKNPAYIVDEDITTSCFPVSYSWLWKFTNVYTLKSSKHCDKKLHSKSVLRSKADMQSFIRLMKVATSFQSVIYIYSVTGVTLQTTVSLGLTCCNCRSLLKRARILWSLLLTAPLVFVQ